MPDTADGAFCNGLYDGDAQFVECTVRDSNVVLRLTAAWSDNSGAVRRDAVEQVVTSFTPVAQHLLVGVVSQL